MLELPFLAWAISAGVARQPGLLARRLLALAASGASRQLSSSLSPQSLHDVRKIEAPWAAPASSILPPRNQVPYGWRGWRGAGKDEQHQAWQGIRVLPR